MCSAYFDEHGNIMVTNEGTLPSQRIAKRFVIQVGRFWYNGSEIKVNILSRNSTTILAFTIPSSSGFGKCPMTGPVSWI